ncbi:hypothetical protein GDO78_021606 [Eleutherodactylus coqui]|uniref:Uncharacterized protein n=1 Tax=Eleutherodactylus coqui TaxID=57060 RepID=A0A8J6BEH8_ELECQ|nr:hypothetical protein GDO78_021606 [Eleutherodactylus coqui]
MCVLQLHVVSNRGVQVVESLVWSSGSQAGLCFGLPFPMHMWSKLTRLWSATCIILPFRHGQSLPVVTRPVVSNLIFLLLVPPKQNISDSSDPAGLPCPRQLLQ